jgi:hypothetical protein
MIDEAAAISAVLLYHFNPIHDGATGGTGGLFEKAWLGNSA